MFRAATRICCALVVSWGLVGAALDGARAESITPEPVFPNLPEPVPPAEFLAMPLYLRTDAPTPVYQPTRLTLAQFLSALPPGGTWRRVRSENGWVLRLVELRVGTRTLEDVAFVFVEDDMAADHAVSHLTTRIMGQPVSRAESYRLGQAIAGIARNGT